MAQRKRRTRQVRDEYEIPVAEAVALLLPNHNQQPGDEWTLFIRDGVLEMVVTRVPETL